VTLEEHLYVTVMAPWVDLHGMEDATNTYGFHRNLSELTLKVQWAILQTTEVCHAYPPMAFHGEGLRETVAW